VLKSAISSVVFILVGIASGCGQNIVSLPQLSQKDSTIFELEFNTDSAAVVTVHVGQDSTYRSAFVFLGRSVGESNKTTIEMAGLQNNTGYFYRLYLGTSLSNISGSFSTGTMFKK
jgi:phosphodiesterase/alkaline phosphatase D-like protein|tara:strand:- start:35 stop:382 length:348 start_codon:yes stop_codon:yes gene_type:complete